MPRFYLYIFIILSCTTVSSVIGQITIDPGNTPPFTAESIIENVFLGNGVEILDISYEGVDASVGLFDNGASSIGLNRGIVLSTGRVDVIPENASVEANGEGSMATLQDDDLEAIAGIRVRDIARYTIEFIPTSDTLRFSYVFASDEYPDLQCTSSNDAFGFFIKGTNPNGPDYDFDNIALIPDPVSPGRFLNLPVTINNVNNGVVPPMGDAARCPSDFSQYYNAVGNNSQPAFNGYLDVFVAEAIVVPCEVYTIKIAIGDGREGEIDSAVFLEEKSFSTGSLEINVDNPGVNGGISEGCLPGNINISLPNTTSADFPIELTVLTDPSLGNLATLNVDYELESNNLIIPAGQSSTSINLMPISDNQAENTEFIYLEIRRDACNVDTLIVPIFDNSLDFVSIPDTVFTCFDTPARIMSTVDPRVNIMQPLVFTNDEPVAISDPDTTIISSIEVSDVPQEFLIPRMIAEICLDTLVHPRLNDLDIYLQAPSGQYIELSTDNGRRDDNDSQIDTFLNTCFIVNSGRDIHLGNPVEGDMDLANPTYSRTYRPEGDWASWLSPIVSPSNGTYNLLITDDQGEFEGELISWHITFNATYEIRYTWSPLEGINCPRCPNTLATVQNSQYYYLELSDTYSCSNIDSVWVQVVEEPDTLEITCESISPNEVIIRWDDVDFATDYEYRINGNSPSFRASRDASFFSFGYQILTFAARNEIRISGLTPEEEIEVIIRGINESDDVPNGSCLGERDTIYCMSLPCADTAPAIDSIVIDQPSCDTQGGSRVQIFASDPDLPLTYRVYRQNTVENQTGIFGSLPQGNTPIRIIDNAGCVTLDTIRIEDPPPVEIIPDIIQITCTDAADGIISLTVNSDNPPYMYEWSHDMSTDSLVSGLSENTYTVTVTDDEGCTNSASYTLFNPEPIRYSFDLIDTINCTGTNQGAASLNIEGGVEPYIITWEGNVVADTIDGLEPGMIMYTIEDANRCIIGDSSIVIQRMGFEVMSTASDLTCFTDSTATGRVMPSIGQPPYTYQWDNGEMTQNANMLHTGDNFVTITDKEGCEVIETVQVDSPPEISIFADINATSCFGGSDGSIDLMIEGGVGPAYSILWFNGETTTGLDNLEQGNYCVTVTDENNCSAIQCFIVPDAIKLRANAIINNVSCEGECDGQIILVPSGGSGSFNFDWEGPEGYTSSALLISDLCVGNYNLTMTEIGNNCREVFNLTVDIEEVIKIIMLPVKFISCYDGNDGILEAVTTGGVEPYNYDWSPNVAISNDSIANNLDQGVYDVTVTDVNGCTSSSQIILSEPDSLMASFENTDIICFGDNTGQSIVSVEGGVSDYLIEWSIPSNGDTISNLTAGYYPIVISDRNGCQLIDSVQILQPENPIGIDLDITDITCFGGSDGIVRLVVSNAADPIQYSIDNVNFKLDSTFLRLSSGDYTAYIIDDNECGATIDFNLPEGEPLVVDLGDNRTVFFESSVVLSAIVENNQGDIFYEWSSASPDVFFSCQECPNPEILDITSSFTVTLRVTDENGCIGSDFINITVDDLDNVEVPAAFTPDLDGSNDRLHVFGDEGIRITSFRIYNRWGAVVYSDSNFETNNLGIGWDGTYNGQDAPRDSYTWTLEYIVRSGRVEVSSGQTILIR